MYSASVRAPRSTTLSQSRRRWWNERDHRYCQEPVSIDRSGSPIPFPSGASRGPHRRQQPVHGDAPCAGGRFAPDLAEGTVQARDVLPTRTGTRRGRPDHRGLGWANSARRSRCRRRCAAADWSERPHLSWFDQRARSPIERCEPTETFPTHLSHAGRCRRRVPRLGRADCGSGRCDRADRVVCRPHRLSFGFDSYRASFAGRNSSGARPSLPGAVPLHHMPPRPPGSVLRDVATSIR